MKEKTSKTLSIGLPKGSLQDSTLALFRKAGFTITVGSRSYIPSIDDEELSGLLIRAQEMARYVQDGILDLGLTGRDWVLEQNAKVKEVCTLQYAKGGLRPVRWVVAVPNDSPIRRIEDLRGKRVATELVQFTRRFLKEREIEALVEFSWGATEVKAPRLADAIVELTETGSSLRANNLRIVDTILESTTVLIANRDAWKDPWKRQKIENIALLLMGALRAQEKVGLKMNVARADLDRVLEVLPALQNPTISSLSEAGWFSLEVIVDERTVRELIPVLKKTGASGIVEYPLNKVIPSAPRFPGPRPPCGSRRARGGAALLRPRRVRPSVPRPGGYRGDGVHRRIVRFRKRRPDPVVSRAAAHGASSLAARGAYRSAARSAGARLRASTPVHLPRGGSSVSPLRARGVPLPWEPGSPVPAGDGGLRGGDARTARAFPRGISRGVGPGPFPREGFPLSRPREGVRLQTAQPVPALDGSGEGRGRPRDLDGPLPAGPGRPPGYPHGPDGSHAGPDPPPVGGLENGGGDHRRVPRRLPRRPGEVRLRIDPDRDPRGMHPAATGGVRCLRGGKRVRREENPAGKLILPPFPPLR